MSINHLSRLRNPAATVVLFLSIAGAPAPANAQSDWTGVYMGFNVGGAWSTSDINYVPPGLPFTGVVPAYSAIGSRKLSLDGFTGGAQLGANWQTGNIVLGVEGDINAMLQPSLSIKTGSPPGNVQLTSRASVSTDWLATLRARLGLAMGPAMIYATGGLAVTELKFSQSNTYAFLGTEAFHRNETRVGWAAGGGGEYAFSPNWSGKAEYLYADFGKISGRQPFPGFAGTHYHEADLTSHIVRVGLNYKF